MRSQCIGFVALVSLLSIGNAHAWSLSEMLGLDKAAREAGAEAAAKVAAATVESSRNILMMTNQFGSVLADYYGSDPQRKADAKRLIEGVFGLKLADNERAEVEVSVGITGLSVGESIRGDLIFVDKEDDANLKSILATGTAFKPEIMNAPAVNAATIDTIKSLTRAQLDPLFKIEQCPNLNICKRGGTRPCVQFANPSDDEWHYQTYKKQNDACLANWRADIITDGILKVMQQTSTTPISAWFSREYRGGKYAVLLIPSDDFKKIDGKTEISVILHKKGKQDERLGVFKTPFTVRHNKLRNQVASTSDEEVPKISFAYIDLRLEGLSKAPVTIPAH